MEKKLVVCDTNVFIHWFNNHQPTIQILKQITEQNICMSTITKMELFQDTHFCLIY